MDAHSITMFLVLLFAVVLGMAEGKCKKDDIIDSGLNCDQKQLILDVHNKFRDKVAAGKVQSQPKAANMIELRWNDSLAQRAQKWANRCVFEHDMNREQDGQPFGQNLAIRASTMHGETDIKALIKLWMDEVKDYRFGDAFSSKTGHYTQMVWGTTRLVGCGLVSYKKRHWYNDYLVCNYSPPGNWIGELPYVKGNQKCEAYKLSKSTSYPKLCSTDNKKVQPCSEKKE